MARQEVRAGSLVINTQRQLNFVDTFSWAIGTHQLKLGIDYRHLSPTSDESTGWVVFPQALTARWLQEQPTMLLLSARDPL